MQLLHNLYAGWKFIAQILLLGLILGYLAQQADLVPYQVVFEVRRRQRRPRCQDGSLDMRFKVNEGHNKHDQVSDYYHY